MALAVGAVLLLVGAFFAWMVSVGIRMIPERNLWAPVVLFAIVALGLIGAGVGLIHAHEGRRRRRAVIRSSAPPDPSASQGSSIPGVAGFVLGFISVFAPFPQPLRGWPLVDLILGILGIVFSGVGMTGGPGRPARGLAIAGLVLSISGIIWVILEASPL